ncbi:MAG: hypothetical protein JXA96_15275 [Sedimentisphaerales bacterium]|nr:hypothetical protein [Sedimentisphaerales bacterium]
MSIIKNYKIALIMVISVSAIFAFPSSQMTDSNKTYDCAANSLYVYCQKANIDISYKDCLGLLPISQNGNSMLDFKNVLEKLGVNVEALKLPVEDLIRIQVPGIVLQLTNSSQMGHYFVIYPLSKNKVQLLDYPRTPQIQNVDSWIIHLKKIGVKECNILLCGKKGQSIDDMLLSQKPQLTESYLIEDANIYLKKHIEDGSEILWDYGNVTQSEILKRDFNVINNTKREIHIKKLIASCGSCATLMTDNYILMPGEICIVTMSLKVPIGYEKELYGYIIFESEDMVQPVRILASGHIHPNFTFKPEKIDFGVCDSYAGIIKKNITVSSSEYANLHVIDVTCLDNYVKTSITPEIKDADNLFNIMVTLNPFEITGKFQTLIAILVEEDSTPSAYCVVSGEVKPSLIINPKRLLLTEAVEIKKVSIKHAEGKRIEIKEAKIVDCDERFISLSYESKSNDTIEICLNNLNKKDLYYAGNIILELIIENEEKPKLIKIPFFVNSAIIDSV